MTLKRMAEIVEENHKTGAHLARFFNIGLVTYEELKRNYAASTFPVWNSGIFNLTVTLDPSINDYEWQLRDSRGNILIERGYIEITDDVPDEALK